MQRKLAIKIAIICFLSLAVLIPLEMISGKIFERQQFQQQAQASIARSWTGPQKLIGPLLVVPYLHEYTTRKWNKESKTYNDKTHQVSKRLLLQPEELTIDAFLSTENRYLGIYEVPVYTTDLKIKGIINNQRILDLAKRQDVVGISQPYMAVSLADIRGIVDKPTLIWQKDQAEFKAGSELSFSAAGIHATVAKLNETELQQYTFDFSLKLRGMQQFEFTPVAKQNNVNLKSAWPHPQFLGRYLPQTREISDKGFTSQWNISSFSTDVERQLESCENQECGEFMHNSFGVALVDPVNVYLQAERSIKYGILFVGLIFVAFFLFEVIQGLLVHPVQYALVGAALSVFYLLLISLSEHISFALSYLIAVIASSGLLAFYIRYVLHSLKLGLIFGTVTSVLYAMLYAIIQSEDHALLMGAILIFLTLVFVMVSTRKINWYELSGYSQPNTQAEAVAQS